MVHYSDHSLTHRLHWYIHNRELHDAAGGAWNLRAILCLSLGDWFPKGSSPSQTLVYPCCVPTNAAERAQCGPVCWAGPFHLGDVGHGTHSRESHTDGMRPGESWHRPPGPQPVPFLVSPRIPALLSPGAHYAEGLAWEPDDRAASIHRHHYLCLVLHPSPKFQPPLHGTPPPAVMSCGGLALRGTRGFLVSSVTSGRTQTQRPQSLSSFQGLELGGTL